MTTPKLIIIGLAAISLSACGASTGGLAKSMAKQAAMKSVTSSPAPRQAVASTPMVDESMDCEALALEMATVDATIVEASGIVAGSGQANIAGQAAAAGASQIALQNGAAGALAKVPFGGLFARSAANALANSGKKKVEKAQIELQQANLRKASLSGLYAGKNCAS